eukprot:8468977-Ditylum_brightwellii.AAC.1
MNHRSAQHVQNMGKSVMCKWSKEAAETLGKDKGSYSGTTWQRSGATDLADCGASGDSSGPAEKKQTTNSDEGDGKVAVTMLNTGGAEVAPESFAGANVVTPVSAAGSPGTADWSMCGTVVINNYFTTK